MAVLSPPKPHFPIGVHDFEVLKCQGYAFVDKSLFIADIVEGAVVTLFPRPRRFGKTLNMTMLRHFFERPRVGSAASSELFSDMAIWSREGGRFQRHHRRYPVISLSFKGVKQSKWNDAWREIRAELATETARVLAHHDVALGSDDSRPQSETLRLAVMGQAQPAELHRLLPALLTTLAEATGESAILLIDEYDAPLHAAWQYGYWDEALEFFRGFLSHGLKDAPHLYRGVLTGILRVAKENIFSGLNNVRVHTILTPTEPSRFGFTEDEVGELVALAGATDRLDGLRQAYDGYRFGGERPVTMFNPWSIMHWLAERHVGYPAYWVNTSANDLARELLTRTAATNGPDLARLVAGETITRVLRDAVPLQDLFHDDELLWPLLTFTGYLTPEVVTLEEGQFLAQLRIPNQEIFAVFRDTFLPLVARATAPREQSPIARAMLSGDTEALEAELGRALVSALSFHDLGSTGPAAPESGPDPKAIEAVYQAFIIGLLLHLAPTHRVVSNREAGYGRADVLVFPRAPGPGVVLELKVITRRDTPETAMARALAQLRDRAYAAELRAAGADPVHALGVVFDGKRCWVEAVQDS
jgi:hypothetical protein